VKPPTSSGTLFGVFEHFADGARRILVLAQEEALNLDSTSIAPEHLLLAMLREGQGIAAIALSEAGVDYPRARELVGSRHRRKAGMESGPEPFTRATMTIMERALQVSWAQADGSIDTEHLLAALLEQTDDVTEAVLAELDVTPQEVQVRIDALLAERAAW
jgi:ATP-dependent Clp protease ATP-binding subunit ClpC